MKNTSDIKRIRLGCFPTPIQKLENISRITGTNVWIKRDDLTGIGLGGNKVRKLEFLMAEALDQGAEVVFTTGQAQSNHAMLTAAACRKLGLEPILILKKRGVTDRKGNLLLNSLMNVDVRFMDTSSYADIYEEMDRAGKELGRKYYKIPCGGSNGLGALGYVDCVREISEQQSNPELNIPSFNYIVCPEGSGGTHAGMALGAMLYMPETTVIGAKVDTDPFEEITPDIVRDACRILELDREIKDDDLRHIDACGSGYAIPSEEGNNAIKMMAEKEGPFLDPVYTGKAFGALLRMAAEGVFTPTDNVLFVYSGGAGGLFAIDVD